MRSRFRKVADSRLRRRVDREALKHDVGVEGPKPTKRRSSSIKGSLDVTEEPIDGHDRLFSSQVPVLLVIWVLNLGKLCIV